MSKTVYAEKVYRVFSELGKGEYLEVGPWPDAPDCLSLRTVDKKSQEWFGNFDMSMSPEFAKKLGEALISAAEDMRLEMLQNGKTLPQMAPYDGPV
jgi:hypothetical protein